MIAQTSSVNSISRNPNPKTNPNRLDQKNSHPTNAITVRQGNQLDSLVEISWPKRSLTLIRVEAKQDHNEIAVLFLSCLLIMNSQGTGGRVLALQSPHRRSEALESGIDISFFDFEAR